MRILSKDTDQRLIISLNKSINNDNNKGIMTFGSENDYPQVIERIVNGSITAKSTRDIYSKFLCGRGFIDESLNDITVSKDVRGKNITVQQMLRMVCDSLAMNNGVYVHMNRNIEGASKSPTIIPFKKCRFSKEDDLGFCSKIAVHDDWTGEGYKQFKKTQVRWYPIFTNEISAIHAQIKAAGSIEKYKGHINFLFFDNQYLYPLSPFDPVYMDCDTEQQVAIYKNNMTRNGMTNKTLIRMVEPHSEEDEEELIEQVQKWQGTDGDNTLIIYDEVDPQSGEIKRSGAFAMDSIESNINDQMFSGWQDDLSNNIRKAVKAIPAILIDYDESKLGTTSGEGIIQATKFYNAMTYDDRQAISGFFKEIFNKSENVNLRDKNWDIKELTLYEPDTMPMG